MREADPFPVLLLLFAVSLAGGVRAGVAHPAGYGSGWARAASVLFGALAAIGVMWGISMVFGTLLYAYVLGKATPNARIEERLADAIGRRRSARAAGPTSPAGTSRREGRT